jgi:hypothetical protein
MCYWGLAYATGPMPNKTPGKIGEGFPVFDATAAQDGFDFAQKASKIHAGKSTSSSSSRWKTEGRLIDSMLERYTGGVRALKRGAWRDKESVYAEQMAKIAEEADPQVGEAPGYM